MFFASKVASLALTGLLLSVSAGTAFAQAGGGDVPTDAKNKGEKEIPGSTGKNDQSTDSGSMKKNSGGGSMEKKSGDKM